MATQSIVPQYRNRPGRTRIGPVSGIERFVSAYIDGGVPTLGEMTPAAPVDQPGTPTISKAVTPWAVRLVGGTKWAVGPFHSLNLLQAFTTEAAARRHRDEICGEGWEAVPCTLFGQIATGNYVWLDGVVTVVVDAAVQP